MMAVDAVGRDELGDQSRIADVALHDRHRRRDQKAKPVAKVVKDDHVFTGIQELLTI